MEIKYINPFIDAVGRVFKDFFKITPDVLKPYIVKKDEEHNWDISGIIGIAGEAKGVVVISFSKNIALKFVSILVDKDITDINEDVTDAIGEVVNIIAGNAKKGLEEYRLMISLPSIISGPEHKIIWPGKNIPIVGIPFSTSYGDFNLSIGLENIISI